MGDKIMTMKSIYTSLNYQKMMYEKQLIEKKRELQDIKVEKQNIIIKKIHGELYYYAQYRKDGKVKSKYLSPVIPGKNEMLGKRTSGYQ